MGKLEDFKKDIKVSLSEVEKRQIKGGKVLAIYTTHTDCTAGPGNGDCYDPEGGSDMFVDSTSFSHD